MLVAPIATMLDKASSTGDCRLALLIHFLQNYHTCTSSRYLSRASCKLNMVWLSQSCSKLSASCQTWAELESRLPTFFRELRPPVSRRDHLAGLRCPVYWSYLAYPAWRYSSTANELKPIQNPSANFTEQLNHTGVSFFFPSASSYRVSEDTTPC